MWDAGMSLGPNTDGNTFPNTDMYQAGAVIPSGVTVDIDKLQGSNFKVKVTLGKKSGGVAMSTPSKEQQQSAEAQEQFRTPDAEEFRMSGKLPQLPWHDEVVAATATKKHEDEQSTIQVWDSVVDASGAYGTKGRRWMGMMLAGVVFALAV